DTRASVQSGSIFSGESFRGPSVGTGDVAGYTSRAYRIARKTVKNSSFLNAISRTIRPCRISELRIAWKQGFLNAVSVIQVFVDGPQLRTGLPQDAPRALQQDVTQAVYYVLPLLLGLLEWAVV